MSKTTKKSLRNLFIYQVYVRNYDEQGTFKSVENDLNRIHDLGVDVVYLLPIHPIGKIKRKGTLGSPYSIQDYRAVNDELGTLDDFKDLIKAVHDKGMKLMMDVVYNHTSYDSVLLEEHPEYFYKNADGEFANRVGDWWDITDFDYTSSKGLWEELIDTLLYWVSLGVDGFRFDVASFLPLEFLEEMRERILEKNPEFILLSESVHGGFARFIRNQGFGCLSESEIYNVFDMAYDYDIHPFYEGYLKGENSLRRYLEELYRQEEIYPENYVKMRNLENHDFGRFAKFVDLNIDKINNWTALNFFSKGASMIFAGQEFLDDNLPDLFDKDVVKRTNGNISELITKLAHIVKDEIFSQGHYEMTLLDKDVYFGKFYNDHQEVYGLFNLGLDTGDVTLELEDGTYTNEIDSSNIIINDSKLTLTNKPLIWKVVK